MDLSFIITSFNYSKYIRDSINSCINQKPSNLKYEVIIIDDGSNDQTDLILEEYKESNIKILHSNRLGVEAASNIAISESIGRYIVRVDADDYLKTFFCCEVLNYINEGYDVIYSDYHVINEDGQKLKDIHLPKFDEKEIVLRGDFLATGTLIRRELFKELNMYNENIKNCGLENYELILKALIAKKTFKHLTNKLFMYRIHNKNLSLEKKEKIKNYGESLFSRLGIGKYNIGIFHPYYGADL